MLVAAHVTWNGFEDKNGEEARRLELSKPRGRCSEIHAEETEAEDKACVWCVGDFNTNPTNDKAWSYFKDAGWKTHVQDSTMVLSNHAYDNIVTRVQEPASNADKSKAVLPKDEFILEHPSVPTGVRARVGVLNLLHHMERVTGRVSHHVTGSRTRFDEESRHRRIREHDEECVPELACRITFPCACRSRFQRK